MEYRFCRHGGMPKSSLLYDYVGCYGCEFRLSGKVSGYENGKEDERVRVLRMEIRIWTLGNHSPQSTNIRFPGLGTERKNGLLRDGSHV